MKRNLRKKTTDNMSSGKRGRAGIWALCGMGAAAVFGAACALVLSAAASPEPRKAAALEAVEIDGSCEAEAGGFLTTINVKGTDGPAPADVGNAEGLLFASVGEPDLSSLTLPDGAGTETDGEPTALPEGIDTEANGETAALPEGTGARADGQPDMTQPEQSEGDGTGPDGETVSKVEYQVEEVTEGEEYDALVAQFAESTDGEAPTQVMKVTATQDGKELDLSGCDITLQVAPTNELVNEAGGVAGMSLTVLPLGGEATVHTFADEEVSGEQLPTVDVSYTVPQGSPVMYAVSYASGSDGIVSLTGTQTITLQEDEVWKDARVVKEGANVTIDLNGHTITWNPHKHTAACYGGELTCGKEEHTHKSGSVPEGCELWGWDESGKNWICLKNPAEGNPGCGKEAHTHTKECYGGEPTCGEKEHEHTSECYYNGEVKDDNLMCVNVLVVKPGGVLTIMDSGEGGSITAQGLKALIDIRGNGELNIKGGKLENAGGQRVILAWESGTVNMSGGTVTGATAGVWGGAGIYTWDGEVNLSGGVITGNKAGDKGGGIYVQDKGTVNVTGGEISGNTSGNKGGGICLDNGTVNISGGEIKQNNAIDGGGIYVEDNADKSNIRVNIKGNASISDNKAERDGGGVWAGWIDMSAGTISGNHSGEAGAGVYAISMKMTGGTISANKVENYNNGYTPRGGGGIYITTQKKKETIDGKETMVPDVKEGDYVCAFDDETTEVNTGTEPVGSDITKYTKTTIKGNMSITGGTIQDNESSHTGGGIFVDIGAVAYISGTDADVHIQRNKALDNSPEGHGYAGGGVFVEHPNAKDISGTAEQGGKVYIYNAVITGNTAKYGGGVAGCGTSNVTICSVNGVAVYGNHLSGGGTDVRYPYSDDLYVDGAGMVDSSMMGGAEVVWEGKYKTIAGATVDADYIQPQNGMLTIADGVRQFKYGFYLKVRADSLTQDEKNEIMRYATVFIENNESNSGGGGVGGNGFMKLGLKSPKPDATYTLEFKKIVTGGEGSGEPQSFDFTVTLKNKEGTALQNSYPWYKYNKTTKSWDKQDEELKPDSTTGEITFSLQNEDHIRIGEVDEKGVVQTGLPKGTQYTIKETTYTGYAPSFEVKEGDWVKDDTKKDEVSGQIIQNNFVVFTNTALYALPATGGETPALYYLLGCALLLTAVTGAWMYRRRSRTM